MRCEERRTAAAERAGRREKKQKRGKRMLAAYWLITVLFIALNLLLFVRVQAKAAELDRQMDGIVSELQSLQDKTAAGETTDADVGTGTAAGEVGTPD